MAKTVVDTHALLWFLGDGPRLGANAGGVLQDPASEIVLPAIVLAEACWIVQRGRVALTVPELMAAIDADSRIEVAPVDRAVIERSVELTTIGEMHDRQIVATALKVRDEGHAVSLLTADANIRNAGLVDVFW